MSSWLDRRRLKRRAGASARRDYLRLTKQWRRENRRPFAIIGTAASILFVALCLLSARHLVNFFAGALAGGFLALFIALLESPPGWIENYQRGAWGEQRTAAVLAPLLDEGWTLIHDLPRTKSNLDHVLIGPGGVFVLDTKSFRGTAEVRRDTLAITYAPGRAPDYTSDKLARSARAQGAELNQILRLRGQARVWVTAAVVLWTDFPQQRAEGDRMVYLHGAQLVAWLREQPARLNATQIDQLAGLLRPGQRRAQSSQPADLAATDRPTASHPSGR